ncbi:acid phosphatase 1-like [Wolffia australiana]
MGRSPSSLLLVFFLAAATAAAATQSYSLLATVPEIPYDIAVGNEDSLFCESWKFSVETNDAGFWKSIPLRCLDFVKSYMNGPRYASDCAVVADESIAYASRVPISGSNDAWIFDVDETLLSNLPYYRVNGYGSEEFNGTSFDEWVDLAEAPAIPASLKLYRELQRLGFTTILLTGRSEHQRAATERNLMAAGYGGWETLILRELSEEGTTAEEYKSARRAALISQGYKIHGNSGDQWSDLIGGATAVRSFKLPNPLYWLA